MPPTPTTSRSPDEPGAAGGDPGVRRRLLITAGPTHEPIDAVRYLANRSSGRLGIALAEAAAASGWIVTLLLGPTRASPTDTRVTTHRFRTTADLDALLQEHLPRCDALVMAAAVADYRPRLTEDPAQTKLRRTGETLTLELESTPDLLAGAVGRRRPGQLIVGFALEPRDQLDASARRKLERKGCDAIVANPLETMDAESIEASLYHRDGRVEKTDGPIAKTDFAPWLLDRVAGALEARTG